MLIVLTDVLSCPRCGPEFGLIVLADRLEERRVVEGALGCANCRETYPIRGGVPDLRFPAGGPPSPVVPPAPDDDRVLRLAALLGVTEGPGLILVAGAGAHQGAELPRLVPGIGVVLASGEGLTLPPRAGVDQLLTGARLPLRSRSVRGVALVGGSEPIPVSEAARVLLPGARLVLEPDLPGAAAGVRAAGLSVLLEQDGIVVASAGAPG